MAPFRAGRGGAPGGFTLLELLVAMTVLSFLIGGLYLSIGTSWTHAHRIGVRLRSRQAVRIAMQRMAADLGGVQWGAGKTHLYFEGKRDSGIDGGRDRLEFTAVRYRWKEADEKADELVSIAYSLRTDGKTANLIREERPLLGGSRRAASDPIRAGVEALSFAYLDGDTAVREGWDPRAGGAGEAALPAAVRISIKIRIEDSDQVFSTLVAVPLGLYDAWKLADEAGAQKPGGGGEAGVQEQGGDKPAGDESGPAGFGQ
ncbi:MAG: type II secretion system protein GspJ [bacterium]